MALDLQIMGIFGWIGCQKMWWPTLLFKGAAILWWSFARKCTFLHVPVHV